MPLNKIVSKKISLFSLFLLSLLFTQLAHADITAPETVITKNPAEPNGNNNWYKNPVEVTINATDLESGIKKILYKVNDDSWKETEFYKTLNLAPNPSFEFQLESWEMSPNDGYLVATPDYTIHKFGQTSVKITSTGIGWHGINHVSKFAVVEPYSTVTLSTWVKTQDVSQNAYFKIYTTSTDAQGNVTKNFIGQSDIITGTHDWTKLSKTVTLNNKNSLGVFMEIGVEGTGILWSDGVNINNSDTEQQIKVYLNKDGNNSLSYYSIDQEGNTESTKNISLKIDQTPPGNWEQPEIIKSPGNPDFVVNVKTKVYDTTSGISDQSKQFQYKIDTEYGTYEDISNCSGNWLTNNWANLQTYPASSGDNSAVLQTPQVNFCDSSWIKCKAIRFKAIDLAGNESTKEFCVNGPWIKIIGGGKVKANKGISMTAQSKDYTCDGIVESGSHVVEFFSTSKGYIAKQVSKLFNDGYNELWNLSRSKKEITELSTDSGSFYIKNNFELNNLPSNYSNQNFTQLIFINGDLTINKDLNISNASALLFVVKGDVKIDKTVKNISAGIISDKNVYTAYNAQPDENTLDLQLKGVFSADKFALQRKYSVNNLPTESFVYEPKYLIKMRDYLGRSKVEWVEN